MTIEEALKKLQVHYNQPFEVDDPDFYPALRLDIEAIKYLQEWRQIIDTYSEFPLPGETKREGKR